MWDSAVGEALVCTLCGNGCYWVGVLVEPAAVMHYWWQREETDQGTGNVLSVTL